MATKKKLLEAAAGAAGGAGGLNVEDVFSTYLYTGNSSTQTITNGIDLAGEGGLVWIKSRSAGQDNHVFDTERGAAFQLRTNTTIASSLDGDTLTQFNSDGFLIDDDPEINGSTVTYASWTFRKAPGFFDVVTYTGDGVAGRTISHNLGSTPGMIIVKSTSNAYNWCVYHSGILASDPNGIMVLNSTNASSFYNGQYFFGNDTGNVIQPTDSVFTVGSNAGTNGSGATYVAYLFAHNNGDGDFGPTGDQDIIKCGSYNGNGSTQTINLGWEPQFVIIKKAAGTGDEGWVIQDVMRGMHAAGATHDDRPLFANSATAEASINNLVGPTATGFFLERGDGAVNASGSSYIYIAIRRGPMAVPESATDVFAIDTSGSTGDAKAPHLRAPFPVDMSIRKRLSGGETAYNVARLISGKALSPDSTAAELSIAAFDFDYMNGWGNYTNTNSDYYGWMWKRAPSFFDVVAYTGNLSDTDREHNLGVVPEMIIIKNRTSAQSWAVYHSGVGVNGYLLLTSAAAYSGGSLWNNTAPTDTTFSIASVAINAVNNNTDNYIAYLFASLDGVSKVGSYTGDGTTDGSKVIDCGFSAGARFVLIKKTSEAGNWITYDTERGIVSGNDSHLFLEQASAEDTSFDSITPNSSGFAVNHIASNKSGVSYIFYAIA